MRSSTWRVALAGALAAAVVLSAATPAYAETAQQEKMKTCNTDATAKGLKGADRKAFMKSCLSKEGAAPEKKLNAQQEKMRSCNADATAKGLKGTERKAFMKSCLKGSGEAH